MDDQRKDLQKGTAKQLQSHNVPTDDVKNTYGTREEIYYSLKKLRTVHRSTERMLQGTKRNRRSTIHWLTHPQGEQNETENVAMAWIGYKLAYDMVLRSSIIDCLKICKIFDEVIKFIKKTMDNWRVELTVG